MSVTSSPTGKGTGGSQQCSSGLPNSCAAKSGRDNPNYYKKHSNHDLEDVSRGKAKRHVDVDEEDVQHASTPDSEENVRYLGSPVNGVHGRLAQRRTLSCCTERLHSEIRTRANQAMP
jgi:hypothetical protein